MTILATMINRAQGKQYPVKVDYVDLTFHIKVPIQTFKDDVEVMIDATSDNKLVSDSSATKGYKKAGNHETDAMELTLVTHRLNYPISINLTCKVQARIDKNMVDHQQQLVVIPMFVPSQTPNELPAFQYQETRNITIILEPKKKNQS